MLIFYRQYSYDGSVTPIVLMDSLRSDDRFSTKEIDTLTKAVPPKLKGLALEKPDIYSVEYSATYSHSGINPGESWRTRFYGTVKNPPGVLISAFSPQYFVSQESTDALKAVIQRVINPQKDIIYATMCVRSTAGTTSIITFPFIAYAAQHRPLSSSTDTEMTINGAGFDDAIIRAKKAVRFDKKSSLRAQLEAFCAPEFKVFFADGLDYTAPPVSEIFRPAMPLNELLGEICTQNLMVYTQENNVLKFYDSRAVGSPKQAAQFEGSFLGRAPIMIYNFALSDYTLGQFSADIFDIKLFSSIAIYNDIGSAVFSGLNKVATPPAKKLGLLSSVAASVLPGTKTATNDKYNFYILAYDCIDGRDTKQLKITATNNWIVSQAKVAGLLENQVYKDALAK